MQEAKIEMIRSFLSKKVEVRDSNINKKGIFAKEKIDKREIICIKGGHILQREEIFSSFVINSYHPISDEFYLGASSSDEEDNIKIFINHSCNPNCGLRGEITFVAIREINADEEITIDYAFIDNENYSFDCQCGSIGCRRTITGMDWKIPILQKKYYPYFAQYLKDKIDLITD